MSDVLYIFLSNPTSGPWSWWRDTATFGVAGTGAEKTELGRIGAKRIIAIIPGQAVRIETLDLPKLKASERLQAVGFAVEDRLGAASKLQHYALDSTDPNRVAIIARDKMTDVVASLRAHGVSAAAVYADYDAVSSKISAYRLPDRLIVTTSPAHTLDADWDDGQMPARDIATVSGLGEVLKPDTAVDLLQGEFDQKRRAALDMDWVKRLAAVAAIALVSGLAFLAFKTRAINLQTDAVTAQIEQVYVGVTGEKPRSNPVRALEARVKTRPNTQGDFVTLMAILMASLQSVEGASIDTLQYDATTGQMTLRMAYPSFQTADQLAAQVTAQGGLLLTGGVREQQGQFMGEATLSLRDRS